MLALVAIVIVFVVENSQPVTVHFWFVSGRPRLIFVVLVCLVVGLVLGYLAGAPGRRSRRRARKERDAGRGGGSREDPRP